MVIFYANKDDKRNLECQKEIDSSVDSLTKFLADPDKLLTCQHDMFNRPLDMEDEVLMALKREPANPLFKKVAEVVLSSTIAVLERQLKRYRKGGDLADPSAEMLDISAAVRL